MEYILAGLSLLAIAGFAGYQLLCYREATKAQYGVRSTKVESD